ncbi:McrC family protein [Spongorhabdus nitratireducens]
MESVITLPEYGYLSEAAGSDCRQVDSVTFQYLEKLSLDLQRGPGFLKLCARNGQKALQVQNYVGVLQTPAGVQIEILPKTSRSMSDIDARQALLNMLRHLPAFRHIETTEAQIASCRMPLLEVFIRQFLQSVNHLVKRGLRSEYVRQEENQSFMKGKLLATKQLRHNLVNRHHFYVEYDEYLLDRPVNRLIHSALKRVSGITRSNASQKLCRELSFAFNDVPLSRNVSADFAAMKLGRGMNHYQQSIAWSRLVLEGLSPLAMQGKTRALSLLFPMEALFESYVAHVLRKQLSPPWQLKEQASKHALVQYGNSHWFRLKPDLLVMTNGRPELVLDTKWKMLDSSGGNAIDKFGLSQADFYQMFAYGHKYLQGRGNLVLIYPKTGRFICPVQQSFDFSSELKLWVVPFDIAAGVTDNKRLLLPDALQSDISCFHSGLEEVENN